MRETKTKYVIEFSVKKIEIGKFGMVTERQSLIKVCGQHDEHKADVIINTLKEIKRAKQVEADRGNQD